MLLAHFGGTARQQNRIRRQRRRQEGGGGGGRHSIPIILGGCLDGISPSPKSTLEEEGCAVHHPFLSFSCFAIGCQSDSFVAMDCSSSSEQSGCSVLAAGEGRSLAVRPVTITTYATRPDVVRFLPGTAPILFLLYRM
jgi:hypothetical protein